MMEAPTPTPHKQKQNVGMDGSPSVEFDIPI